MAQLDAARGRGGSAFQQSLSSAPSRAHPPSFRHSQPLSPREQWALSITERAHAVSLSERPGALPPPVAHSFSDDDELGVLHDEPPVAFRHRPQGPRQVPPLALAAVPASAAAPQYGASLMDAEHVRSALEEFFDKQGLALERLLLPASRGVREAKAASGTPAAADVGQLRRDLQEAEAAGNVSRADVAQALSDLQVLLNEQSVATKELIRSAVGEIVDHVGRRVEDCLAGAARQRSEEPKHHEANDEDRWIAGPAPVDHACCAARGGRGCQSPLEEARGGRSCQSPIEEAAALSDAGAGAGAGASCGLGESASLPVVCASPWTAALPPGAVQLGRRASTYTLDSESGGRRSTAGSAGAYGDRPSRGQVQFVELSRNASIFVDVLRRASLNDEDVFARAATKLHSYNEWISNLEEPKPTRLLGRIVHSFAFEFLSICAIILNTALVWHTTDYEMAQREILTAGWLTALEYAFIAFYAIELCLRLASGGVYFFLGAQRSWHLFDSVVLCLGLFRAAVSKTETDWTVLRMLRTLRLVRVVHAIKLMQTLGLEDLMLMLTCVVGSMSQLFWSICLIAFIDLVFGICFVQILSSTLITNSSLTPGQEQDILDKFGSVSSAMLSLVMATTGGEDWTVAFQVVSHAGVAPQLLFLFFILFSFLSLWNVITSSFVEKALKLGRPTSYSLHLEALKEERQSALELRQLFKRADLDESSKISLEEFRKFCQVPEFITYLRRYGLDIKEANSFYHMLVDAICAGGHNHDQIEVDIDELVAVCLRVKGQATSVDLHTVRFELQQMGRAHKDLASLVRRLLRSQHISTDRHGRKGFHGTSETSPHEEQSARSLAR